MIVFGTLAYGFALGVFIFFAYVNIANVLNVEYVSLQYSSQNCHTLPIPVSGTYIADTSANWIGEQGFQYSLAPHSFTFQALSIPSNSEYRLMMRHYRRVFNEMTQQAEQHDMAFNLIAWISFLDYYYTEVPSGKYFICVLKRLRLATTFYSFSLIYNSRPALCWIIQNVISAKLALDLYSTINFQAIHR